MKSDMIRDLWRHVRLWWSTDRIRISPSEGRLLRIEPGDLIRVGTIEAEVVARSVVNRAKSVNIILNCHTQEGTWDLRFRVNHAGKPDCVFWEHEDVVQTLSQDELEIWSRRRML